MLIVFTTVSSESAAEKIAKEIVEKKLAACVQVLPKMRSFYFWEGEVQVDSEHLLLIKTLESNYAKVEGFLKENHSYDTPEIVAVRSEKIEGNYLGWMKDYLK